MTAAAPLAVLDAAEAAGDAVGLLDIAAQSLRVDGDALVVKGADRRLIAVARRLGWLDVREELSAVVLTREAPPRQTFRWIGAAEEAAMRGLFERIFGQTMSEAQWQWKYGAGRGVGLGLWINGELMAHYGGTTRDTLAFGQALRACQVCDVMVAPQARGGLARQGPLAISTATFLEHQIGHGLPHAIGFGFPSDRHHGVAERMRLYEAVDQMLRFEWPAAASKAPWRWRPRELALSSLIEDSPDWQALQGLWQRMSRRFESRVLGVRDPAWLRHRYGRRPGVAYEGWLLSSRWSGRPQGLLVVRRHADRLEALDLVAEPSCFAQLIALAQRLAADAGLAAVEMWVTASQQSMFTTPAFGKAAVGRLGILVPANAHSPGPPPAQFRDKWFLMSGDTDYR